MVLSTNSWAIYLIFFILFLWTGILTYWIYQVLGHYKRLVRGSRGSDLKTVLEHLLKVQSEFHEHINKIEQTVVLNGQTSQLSLQKVGLVRFSPYLETGGNQSFALALLNAKDNGVVLLSLHSREGTRIYIKPISKGESSLELSKEEKQAVIEARRQR